MTLRQPTLFIPHGGGPCFFMEWDPPQTWLGLQSWLAQLPALLPHKPKALLVVSGHWETSPTVSITANPKPELIYDYSGFPPHTYDLQWPASGAPELAQKVQTLLAAADIPARLDEARGVDHGVFIPLKVAFPAADVPTIQISLRADLDPAFHLQLGQALQPLRDDGVLIIGSGMSFHNMRAYRWHENTPVAGADVFDQWLATAVQSPAPQRGAHLAQWLAAEGARFAHPREEHLLPLMVAAGAAGEDTGRVLFHERIMGTPIAGYGFGL